LVGDFLADAMSNRENREILANCQTVISMT